MTIISLAEEIPKSAVLVEAEDGAYFFMILIGAVVVLGIIFFPAQIQSIIGGVYAAFLSPAAAFIHGLTNFFLSFITDILGLAWKGIEGGASSLYGNTIGRL